MRQSRFPKMWHGRSIERLWTIEHGMVVRSEGGWVIPDFQRPLVWTTEQKQKFVESILMELPIGAYCYHEAEDHGWNGELLDGQQRWSAIYDFVDGVFPAFGLFWNDLSSIEQRMDFLGQVFPAFEVRGMTYEQKLEIFERLAYGGTPNVRSED